MVVKARLRALLLIAICGSVPPMVAGADTAQTPDDVYATYGVHSSAHADDCTYPTCVYERKAGEPTDAKYPAYWTSRWAMYRVYNQYQQYPPPYSGKPPAPLREGVDYQKSWGTTYYDSTWSGSAGQKGAMEEHYEKFCLPIFPISNNYTCSFISLGETAFFVTYADRPKWMPPVCLFSPRNHPPERDFIKHLPYAAADGQRLQGAVNGYSFWVGQQGKPIQTGVSPDQTANGGILFGYAFDSKPTPDRVDPQAPPYHHPSSFYFSGVPLTPAPDAPIVSQNYVDFAMLKPDPTQTWAQVSGFDPAKLPACQLFDPPQAALDAEHSPRVKGARLPPTWGSLGKHK